MTESIKATFKTEIQAEAAEAELSESGIRESDMRLDPDGLKMTIIASEVNGTQIREVVQRHGGEIQVAFLSDPGMIPSDPLGISDN